MASKDPKQKKALVLKKLKNKAKPSRSRNGCLSCKKLRIKCDEGKPKCEYCEYRGKECIYLPVQNVATFQDVKFIEPKIIEISNDRIHIADRHSKMIEKKSTESRRPSIAHALLKSSLNSSSSIFNMRPLDLKLVHFFDHTCLPMFVFERDKRSSTSFNKLVPYLFANYPVVRSSIYSLSCLFLWIYSGSQNIMESTGLSAQGLLRDAERSSIGEISSEVMKTFKNRSDIYLYVSMSEYFGNALKQINNMVSCLGTKSFSIEETAALSFSNMLIFTFLGFHDHKLVSLVDFDSESPHDFLSICAGMRYAHIGLSSKLPPSWLAIFPLYFTKPLKRYGILPCMISLNNDLVALYSTVPQNDENMKEMDILKEAVDVFEFLLVNAANSDFTNVLAAWPLKFPHGLFQLIRSKNDFALRLLYVYSMISIMIGFLISRNDCMWRDYVEWYRNYNLQKYNCEWLNTYDANFYHMVIHLGVQFENSLSALYTFDPENNVY